MTDTGAAAAATSVYAFRPRSIDPPRYLADTRDDLADRIGEYVGAGQCDNCGNSTYRLAEYGVSSGCAAICEANPDDDPEFKHPEPCGAAWHVRLYPESECEF